METRVIPAVHLRPDSRLTRARAPVPTSLLRRQPFWLLRGAWASACRACSAGSAAAS